MIIFYSGSRSEHVSPEDLLIKEEAGFMLTYSGFHKGSKKNETIRRFREHKARMADYEKKDRKKS